MRINEDRGRIEWNDDELDELVPAWKAARFLSVSEATLRKYRKLGWLRTIKAAPRASAPAYIFKADIVSLVQRQARC